MRAIRPDVEALATKLLRLAAELHEAQRPIDRKTSRAKFDGACEVANVLGYGITENEVALAVLEFVRANPRPAANTWNHERKSWVAQGIAEVGAKLHAMGPDRPMHVGLVCPECGGIGLNSCVC